jgi:hypothetical protein
VTALSLAAEDTLDGQVEPHLATQVVSRLLTMSEAEAFEFIKAVPARVGETANGAVDCPLAGACLFAHVAAGYIKEPRRDW